MKTKFWKILKACWGSACRRTWSRPNCSLVAWCPNRLPSTTTSLTQSSVFMATSKKILLLSSKCYHNHCSKWNCQGMEITVVRKLVQGTTQSTSWIISKILRSSRLSVATIQLRTTWLYFMKIRALSSLGILKAHPRKLVLALTTDMLSFTRPTTISEPSLRIGRSSTGSTTSK